MFELTFVLVTAGMSLTSEPSLVLSGGLYSSEAQCQIDGALYTATVRAEYEPIVHRIGARINRVIVNCVTLPKDNGKVQERVPSNSTIGARH